MDKIIDRVKEILNDKEVDIKDLAKFLELSDIGLVYVWKNGNGCPSTKYMLKLAEYFDLSMEYIFCRTEDEGNFKLKNFENFHTTIKKLMDLKGKTTYQMIYKDKIATSNNFTKWKKGSIPTPETLIKLADYFSVSVDELLSV